MLIKFRVLQTGIHGIKFMQKITWGFLWRLVAEKNRWKSALFAHFYHHRTKSSMKMKSPPAALRPWEQQIPALVRTHHGSKDLTPDSNSLIYTWVSPERKGNWDLDGQVMAEQHRPDMQTSMHIRAWNLHKFVLVLRNSCFLLSLSLFSHWE